MLKPRHLILSSNIPILIDEYLARTNNAVCEDEAQESVSLDETFSSIKSYINPVRFGLLLDH